MSFGLNGLFFGNTVWSFLAVLSEDLKNAKAPDYFLNYFNDFCCRLHFACTTAHKNIGSAQKKMK